jgi:hypothetical protein
MPTPSSTSQLRSQAYVRGLVGFFRVGLKEGSSTRLAKPEKKAGKGNERREIYANQTTKANGRRPLNLRDTAMREWNWAEAAGC